jgi:hypothetical protein
VLVLIDDRKWKMIIPIRNSEPCFRSKSRRLTPRDLVQSRLLLVHVIAAKHRCCCYSEDAYVAKIDFMYFNPGFYSNSFSGAGGLPAELVAPILRVSSMEQLNHGLFHPINH